MWSDHLRTTEVEFTQMAIDGLRPVSWAEPLLQRLEASGGICSENMPLMFEVRFAYELWRAGLSADYEYNAGVGNSTVEFRVETSSEWLIELVSIRASQASKRAMRQSGLFWEQTFRTDSEDEAQSPEAEMITAEQKIGEKVFTSGAPTKFPEPSGSLHAVVADARGYLDHGGDFFDYLQMAHGAPAFKPRDLWNLHYWEERPGELEPIKGLYEDSNPLQSAKYVQERIHFLGFVCESEFRDDEIPDRTVLFHNPHLFADHEHAIRAFETYPLRTRNEESK